MDNGLLDQLKDEVRSELERSDIVWPKYGTSSIEELSERIVVRLGTVLNAEQRKD